MNDRLLEILFSKPDFPVPQEDRRMLERFADYLDHGSLFLTGYEGIDDPTFLFSNDAQRYRFRLSEIREHMAAMKRGEALDWERLPFEYIAKGV